MVCWLCLLTGLMAGPSPPGAFLFFHHRLIGEETSPAEWERLKKFRLLLTNGYATFSPEKVAALHESGGRLFFYFWFNGFYEWEARQPMPDGDWRREVLEQHPEWLLNPDGPEQGNGAVKPAYFYDFTQAELRRFLARAIAAHRQRTGYDGVFFDYAGSYPLPPSILERHQQRHPDLPYDEAGALFLRVVRATDPGLLMATNQAHRAAQHLLPCTDVDVGESLATSFLWGKEIRVLADGEGWVETRETFYRPWAGIKACYTDVLEKVRRFNPQVRFVTINYVKAFWEPTGQTAVREGKAVPVYRRRPDRAAIFYGYAAAKLFGLDSYSSDWYDVGCSDDDVFLLDLGRPLGSQPEEREGVVVRCYEKGLVALTTTEQGGVFDVSSDYLPAGLKGLEDVYERRSRPASREQCRLLIEPTIYPVSGSTYPSGRVYLYVQ